LPGAAGDAGGDVQHEVAERRDFGVGQCGCAGEAEEFGPAHQICGGEQGVQPRGVLGEPAAREVAHAGGFGFADASPVFHAGVLSVVEFQTGGLPGDHTIWNVGDDRGDAHAVGVM
jgi:hypothetical protein